MLYSTESNPLRLWRKIVKNGHIKCVMDEEINSLAIEVQGINTRTTYITCPVDPEDSLGIRQPFLNMLLKKTGEDFSFEITVIDDKNIQRQICFSTWQTAKNQKNLCVIQLRLSTSWDYFNINLARVTNALFETKYVETVKVKINANCQIRSVYFSDRVYSNDELPNEYKVNFSGAKQTEPSRAAAMADSSLLVPAGSGRQRRRGLHHLRTGTGLQPTGEEYICGLYTILNSTDKEPLRFWATEVENGHIERVIDREINAATIELQGR
uniref:CFA20 domain-containing protein n=1 Tax=Tetraodon nigroviridis TaxID=99883 RepID=H3D458_TETNG